MQRLATTLAVLILSGGLAFAQSGGGAGGGGTTSGTTGTNAASQSGALGSSAPGAPVNGPNNTGGPVPGLSTPSPADSSTVGRAPGVNPMNSQDATRRGNPSDRTLPAARNPQDMKLDNTGTPQIVAPERR